MTETYEWRCGMSTINRTASIRVETTHELIAYQLSPDDHVRTTFLRCFFLTAVVLLKHYYHLEEDFRSRIGKIGSQQSTSYPWYQSMSAQTEQSRH